MLAFVVFLFIVRILSHLHGLCLDLEIQLHRGKREPVCVSGALADNTSLKISLRTLSRLNKRLGRLVVLRVINYLMDCLDLIGVLWVKQPDDCGLWCGLWPHKASSPAFVAVTQDAIIRFHHLINIIFKQ